MENFTVNFNIPADAERIITPLVIFPVKGKPFPVCALWDTGSTNCCINANLAREKSLVAVGTADLFGHKGRSENPVYPLDLLLADGIMIPHVFAAGITTSESFDFIIGMNIIRLGDFSLIHKENKMMFIFSAHS
jgi:hypothetical protein